VSLRPNEYASKFLGLWAAQLRSGNVIRAPWAPRSTRRSTSVILPRSPVEALLTDRLLGQKAPLTEPRSQSARELADTLAGHGCRCFLYGCRWTVTSVYPMDRLS
jgi:hypothetical protein